MLEVRVPLYYAAQWPADTLPALYAELSAAPDTAWLWGTAQPLSLTQFIQYFSLGPCVLLLPSLLTDAPPTVQDVLGLIWLTQVFPGHRAIPHFYVFPRFRHRRDLSLRAVGRAAIWTMRAPPLGLRTLYFFTPLRHPAVLNYSRKMGVQYTGTLPQYHQTAAGFEDVAVGFLDLTI